LIFVSGPSFFYIPDQTTQFADIGLVEFGPARPKYGIVIGSWVQRARPIGQNDSVVGNDRYLRN
jgi:hypothetical protein